MSAAAGPLLAAVAHPPAAVAAAPIAAAPVAAGVRTYKPQQVRTPGGELFNFIKQFLSPLLLGLVSYGRGGMPKLYEPKTSIQKTSVDATRSVPLAILPEMLPTNPIVSVAPAAAISNAQFNRVPSAVDPTQTLPPRDGGGDSIASTASVAVVAENSAAAALINAYRQILVRRGLATASISDAQIAQIIRLTEALPQRKNEFVGMSAPVQTTSEIRRQPAGSPIEAFFFCCLSAEFI